MGNSPTEKRSPRFFLNCRLFLQNLKMADFKMLKGAALAVILACLLDFGVNMIYAPAITSSMFICLILSMFQIVTILLLFFSWFFLMNMTNSVRYDGYFETFKQFWPLFATTTLYLVFFLINIIMQFIYLNRGNDIYDLWDKPAMTAFWSIQRLFAFFHYGLSAYFVLRLLSDPAQFL